VTGTSGETTGVALYYPYIHVRSQHWLKMAVLYWDTIRRIVPHGFEPDEDEFYGNQPAVDEGLVESITPDQYLAAAATRFRETVLPTLQRDATRGDLTVRTTLQGVDYHAAQPNFYVMHPGKLDPTLRDELLKQEFAVFGEVGPDLLMSREVGIAYMVCLAHVMSTATHAEPVTHDPAVAKLSAAFSFQPKDTANSIPAVVELELPFPDAEALAHVSWEKLLAFRRTNEQQRVDFRNLINEVAKKIPRDADPQAITDSLKRERRRLKKAVADHKKAIDRLITTTTASTLQLSIPTTIAAGLAHTALPSSSVIALSSTAFATVAIGWWAKFQTERAKLLESPYQYLLGAQQLARPPLWRRLLQ
jgi:hypothetical protein